MNMVAVVSGSSWGLAGGSAAVLGGAGQAGQALQGQSGEAIRLNAATGNLVVQVRDELVTGRGLDAMTLRTYNSQGGWDGDNNDQWRLSTSRRVVLSGTRNTAGSTVTRTNADGFEAVYAWDAANTRYVNRDGAGAYDLITWNTATSEWICTDGNS